MDNFLDLRALRDSKLSFNPHTDLCYNKTRGVLAFISDGPNNSTIVHIPSPANATILFDCLGSFLQN